MTTEVYIENYRLDITSDISSLITYELDNIKDFAARSTTWSKTIVLPGTANNNKLFGHIFQIGQSNSYSEVLPNVGYNFNASKSADCIIFQDQLQTFRGVIRLLQINMAKGRPEYEVAVFGKLAGLNVSLGSKYLTDLDFSAYDHTYNVANIIASWDNPGGSGYYYPLIDFGTYSIDKKNWDIRTFRPALYVKEYIDKMFAAAGFRYSSDLFETTRFKKLIVPHNQKNLQGLGVSLVTATAIVASKIGTDLVGFENFSATDFTLVDPFSIRYDGADSKWVDIKVRLQGFYTSELGWQAQVGYYNGAVFEILGFQNFAAVPFSIPYVFEITVSRLVNTGDIIFVNGLTNSGGADPWTVASGYIRVDNQAGTTVVNINPGDQTQINRGIPVNVRQIDFLVSIVKLFNLYVWEDKFDPTLIYIKPFIDFYSTNSADAKDWTYKVNRDKPIRIKPMSELNARNYLFKYRSDSDYFNDLYRKRYGEGYGDYVFDSKYEFAESENSLEIIFSATPLVGYDGEEKVYPTIYKKSGETEERTDSNIRILQTKKITGVPSYDIKNGVTVLSSLTYYGYAGHLDDPDSPGNDLNFGALKELFFVLVTGNLSVTQFNVYWSGYMAEITDKDSKLVTLNVYLTPKDILDLDFSKKIFIDGVLFRLNSIKDYNTSRPSDCQVELLKINYLTYSESVTPPGTGFILHDTGLYLLDNDGGRLQFL